MKKILQKPSGNISIAMLSMVLSIMSGFTLTSMALKDIISFQYEYENAQSLLLLRSEAYRGQAITQKLGRVVIAVPTTERTIEVRSSALKKTFKIKSLITPGHTFFTDENVTAGDQKQVTEVHSRVNIKAGVGHAAFISARNSIVRKYGVFTLETETFAKFMYFTDKESDPNGGAVRFYGPDVLYGRVHSNSDIWIRQLGGGSNNGWPTFYGWVSTAGVIKVYPDGGHNFPEPEIFRGGLSEHYPYTIFPDEAHSIRRNGLILGPRNYMPDKYIVYANVEGTGCHAMLGSISDPKINQSAVYTNNSYPPGQGDPAWLNRYSVRDTIWTYLGSSSTVNKSRYVNNRLWIKGTFGTYQTFGSRDTMFLIGDILLRNTQRGTSPAANRTDVVGLVSEKSILIKYGYRDPVDSSRVHCNMGPTSGNPLGGIWIYAALAALGDGGNNPRKDGVFTFEYQHPHPSVPDVRLNGVDYTRIDIHRRRFPQTEAQRWPPLIDYPWYNPLWPERHPYCERGYINIHGSVSQRRRGFVHRNYVDTDYQNPQERWNQVVDWCGGSSSPTATLHTDPVLNITLGTINYPSASGSGVGYQKNYHYDDRFYRISPVDFPEINRRDETPFAAVKWEIKSPRNIPGIIIN